MERLMNWKEICRIWRATPQNKRAAALADALRTWAELYQGSHLDFENVCEFIANALDKQADTVPRARETRRGWTIIDNVARREVEQGLHEAGIIEDPSLDGGLNG